MGLPPDEVEVGEPADAGADTGRAGIRLFSWPSRSALAMASASFFELAPREMPRNIVPKTASDASQANTMACEGPWPLEVKMGGCQLCFWHISIKAPFGLPVTADLALEGC